MLTRFSIHTKIRYIKLGTKWLTDTLGDLRPDGRRLFVNTLAGLLVLAIWHLGQAPDAPEALHAEVDLVHEPTPQPEKEGDPNDPNADSQASELDEAVQPQDRADEAIAATPETIEVKLPGNLRVRPEVPTSHYLTTWASQPSSTSISLQSPSDTTLELAPFKSSSTWVEPDGLWGMPGWVTDALGGELCVMGKHFGETRYLGLFTEHRPGMAPIFHLEFKEKAFQQYAPQFVGVKISLNGKYASTQIHTKGLIVKSSLFAMVLDEQAIPAFGSAKSLSLEVSFSNNAHIQTIVALRPLSLRGSFFALKEWQAIGCAKDRTVRVGRTSMAGTG